MWKPLIGKNSSSAVRKLHLAQMPVRSLFVSKDVQQAHGSRAAPRRSGLHGGAGERIDQGRLRVHRPPVRSERHARSHPVHGEIVFQTSRGEVRCQDAGAYTIDELESGPGAFASVCTITRGTGDWAGATGHIRTYGTFTLAEGGNSHYEGLISR